MSEIYDYRCGVQPLCEVGAVRPLGKRVLLRAILSADNYNGPLWMPPMQSTDADCFEVVAVGPDAGDVVKPGQHVEVRSTAADRVDAKKLTGRFWNVSIEDVTAVWDPQPVTQEIADACNRIVAAESGPVMPAPSNGEAELTPVISSPSGSSLTMARR